MKEFLNCIWNIIKDPYMIFGIISTIIIFVLKDVKIDTEGKIYIGDKNDKE